MLVFVDEITPRIEYTFDFIFRKKQIKYHFTCNKDFFIKSNEKKFSYSKMPVADELHIQSASVLYDNEIIIYNVHNGSFNDFECLRFDRLSDPFASIFYILSRMEEYTTTIFDEHDRVSAHQSVLFHYNWLNKAMCDRWLEGIVNYLNEQTIIAIEPMTPEYKIVPSFDIDNAFAYQLKVGIRKWMSKAKDVVEGNHKRIEERKKVLNGQLKDPYDTYDYIVDVVDRGFEVKVFWHLGSYAKYDKNVSYKNQLHQALIHKMSKFAKLGIHPSYRSNLYEHLVKIEKERLEKIVHQKITCSRQHFLKLNFPSTYQNLIKSGIEHDYTMGYASEVGFRAGTAKPFLWFDLQKNEVTNLTIHPFAYMDGTLNEYMKVSPEKAMKIIDDLFMEVKNYGGDFIFIWHNETINDEGIWKGWKKVLEHSLHLK